MLRLRSIWRCIRICNKKPSAQPSVGRFLSYMHICPDPWRECADRVVAFHRFLWYDQCKVFRRLQNASNLSVTIQSTFKFGFVGLTEKSASLLVMTPPPASREPPRRGSLLPRPAVIRYPKSDSYPRLKAPSPRGLRPQAVGEFTVMGFFTLSNSSINSNFSQLCNHLNARSFKGGPTPC